jgi:hypothetical protein
MDICKAMSSPICRLRKRLKEPAECNRANRPVAKPQTFIAKISGRPAAGMHRCTPRPAGERRTFLLSICLSRSLERECAPSEV